MRAAKGAVVTEKPRAKSPEPVPRAAPPAQEFDALSAATPYFLRRKCAACTGEDADVPPGSQGESSLPRYLQHSIGAGAGGAVAAQSAIRVGAPDDHYEREADAVAERVMRMPGAEAVVSAAPASMQRQCVDCEGQDRLLQTKPVGGADAGGARAPASVDAVLRSRGRGLDAGTRSFFEPRFGRDFSAVQVHSDTAAQQSAREVNAQAYTVGRHIVFGADRYRPQTDAGRRLLSHELAHVVQQGAVTRPTVQRQSGDPLEEMSDEKKDAAPPDPATQKARAAGCSDPCGPFPWIEVAKDVFVGVCDASVGMFDPVIKWVGCTAGRVGNLGFFAGAPAWQSPSNPKTANIAFCGSGNSAGIEVGYIQTVEKCLSGGVYFQKKDGSDQWTWAGNKWFSVSNTRDGESGSTPPWYGMASGNAGPKPYGETPTMSDSPSVAPIRSHLCEKTDNTGALRGKFPLRRLRIDGIFHLWLVARLPSGSLVYLHNWNFQGWAVAELADDADPCNKQWQIANMNKLLSSGTGKGSATPVLTGGVANDLKKDVSDMGEAC